MGEIAAIDLLVIVVVGFLIYGLIMQVLIPIFTARPLFSIFRRRRLTRDLEEVHEALDEALLQRRIDAERRRITSLQKTSPDVPEDVQEHNSNQLSGR